MSELVLAWPEGEPVRDALFASAGITRLVRSRAEEDSLGRLVRDALWPGIRRPASRVSWEAEVASASNEPWVDSNGYLVEYWRALDSSRPVWLAQAPPEREDVQFVDHTIELALVEARLAGGNFILRLPKQFRDRLFASEPKALAAWSHLAATSRWLKDQSPLFGLTPLPNITALVEPGVPSREIANLLHRRGGSPLLTARLADSGKPAALVAAGLKAVPPAAYDAARSGAILVTDQPAPPEAKLTRQDTDRAFYTLGQGSLVAYSRRIADPSEFALDVIDLITHKRRATRIWNASSVIPVATTGPTPAQALLRLVNYGGNSREEVQAHIQGHFSRATLLRPGQPDLSIKTARRGPSTEVFVPTLERLAIVRFSN